MVETSQAASTANNEEWQVINNSDAKNNKTVDQQSNSEQPKQVQEAPKKHLTWNEKVQELQGIPERIRNICILAHVDHGKTTLSDCLISSNDIISKKTAGQIRYLDSREDEQERMITMKSSSISILYAHQEIKKKDGVVEKTEKHHLFNLIDSPGHVDFSVEVSSAVRVSDGAFVVIDVIEGFSPQTCTVIRQAFDEQVKTCLILNKVDRLILEREMDGSEIYVHITQIIEQANSFIAELIQGEKLINEFSDDKKKVSQIEQEELVEKMEEEFFYQPEKGNVAFCSAIDNWAFTLTSFAPRIAKQLGMNPRVLRKFLWGSNFYMAKDKKIVKKPPHKDSKEMFVQYVMNPLIQEYRKAFTPEITGDTGKQRAAHQKIKTILSKGMPVDKGLLSMAVEHLPSPLQSQVNKVKVLSAQFLPENYHTLSPEVKQIKQDIIDCKRDESAKLVAFVSKMQPVESRLYSVITRQDISHGGSQKLIAVTRVYSGFLKIGQKVNILGPNHLINGKHDVTETTIKHLFLLMGSTLQLVKEAGPGCIIGIGGLDEVLVKSGTICSDVNTPNFCKIEGISMGLVKVSIESENLSEMSVLKQGLEKLNRADPSVEFYISKQGEFVLSTCGEVHLEKCLKDVKDSYAPGVVLQVGEPIIPFRETIANRRVTNKERKIQKTYEELNSDTSSEEDIDQDELNEGEQSAPKMTLEDFIEKFQDAHGMVKKEQTTDMYIEKLCQIKLFRGDPYANGQKPNCATDTTANQKCSITVRAVGLDYDIAKWLISQKKIIGQTYEIIRRIDMGQEVDNKLIIENAINFVNEFRSLLVKYKTDKILIRLINEKLQCFGPKRIGANLLLNKYLDKKDSMFYKIDQLSQGQKTDPQNEEEVKVPQQDQDEEKKSDKRIQEEQERQLKLQKVLEYHDCSEKDILNGFIGGFDYASVNGPLTEEPMEGACFIIDEVNLVQESEEDTNGKIIQDTFGSFQGQVISIVKDLCKKAFLNAKPRIAEGIYKCSLQATPENYGIVYGLIHKCRGTVVEETVQDGTNYYLMDLKLPLVESFLFTDEIRKKCQGIAYPQLVFGGYQIFDNDPFYIPKTEVDLEDHGMGDILPPNPAKTLIEKVRKRKGLLVDQKTVVAADKQRTLGKNK